MEIEEAVALLEKNILPVSNAQECPLCESFSRVLSDNIYAQINVPPFAKSAMDGYAVRAADLTGASKEAPVQLQVTGQLFAGDWKDIPYRKNTAIRVMTGSPVPQGFDAVVMQEDTDYGEDKVLVYKAVLPGKNYCAAGEDIKKGGLILERGRKIGRGEIGLLASLGFSSVKVRRSARVALLNTGSELLMPGQPLAEGKIYSSIGSMLSASIKNAGLEISTEKIIKDDEKEITTAIKKALKTSDLLITTGGVSVGKKDLLPAVLKTLGAKTLFTGVNIKPGTPTTASLFDGKVILSLSGNPYAALVNFDIYFYYAAASLMQCNSLRPVRKEALLADSYEKTNSLRRFVRARLDCGKVYLPSQNHASSVISNLTDCNCYLDLPAGASLKAGEKVQVWMMGE